MRRQLRRIAHTSTHPPFSISICISAITFVVFRPGRIRPHQGTRYKQAPVPTGAGRLGPTMGSSIGAEGHALGISIAEQHATLLR